MSEIALKTKEWYANEGWSCINLWLTEMAAKNVSRVYVGNFEIFPAYIDKEALLQAFNSDTRNWVMRLDSDNEFVCTLRN